MKMNKIDELIKTLYDLCGNMVFLEFYSHDDCACWKILNPFTNYGEHKIVLCRMDEGIEKALTVAIQVINFNKMEFFRNTLDKT